MNSLKVEFDDGWRGSKVSLGERSPPMCQTCGEKAGIERYDNRLSCGVHCAECFDEMVSDARKRSW